MITNEQAEAAKEVAKTTGKFAEIAEKVGGFVSKVIGPASNQIGGILEDRVRYFRYKNLLAIADKVEAIHAHRRIDGKATPIPARVAIPLLESAALEDDETLQDVWARLIANSTDPAHVEMLHPGYIEVVKQMSPDEATILKSFLKLQTFPILFENHVSRVLESSGKSMLIRHLWRAERDVATYEKIYEMFQEHCNTLPLKQLKDCRIYIDNLVRLRIIEFGQDFLRRDNDPNSFFRVAGKRSSPDSERPSVAIPARHEFLRMTAFGQSLVVACIERSSEI